MSAPTVYSEKTLAEYMARELGKVAELLGYITSNSGPGSYAEAVNECLLELGLSDVSQAADMRLLRATARVGAWHMALADLSVAYPFKTEQGSFERDVLYQHALQCLGVAQNRLDEIKGQVALILSRQRRKEGWLYAE